MNWIILALTLGASITSIIHGVFMLFGSLAISGGPLPGIPSTMLASLPIVAAVFALIGGIIAFNRSKWGSLFLLIATGICAASRDTWLYGGLYVFAGLFCFFLKSKQRDYMAYGDFDEDLYLDEEGEGEGEGEPNYDEQYTQNNEGFYYDNGESFLPQHPVVDNIPGSSLNLNLSDGDISVQQPVVDVSKVRHRTSKSCPTCGEIVSRDANFCPTCGTRLFGADNIEITPPILSNNTDKDNENLEINQQLLAPVNSEMPKSDELEAGLIGNNNNNDEISIPEDNANLNLDDGDDMSRVQTAPKRKVLVRDRRGEEDYYQPRSSKRPIKRLDEAASSYQEFSQLPYTRRAKRRKRSGGRKILSIMLLVAAVGGALYFLLGLRKLPPGDLPPMVQPDVITANNNLPPVNSNPSSSTNAQNNNATSVAEPVGLAVPENALPSFTPEREPRNGIITGNNVNFREDHTTSSKSLGKLKVNTRVEVLDSFNVPSGKNPGLWYQIRINGDEGWVYGQYLSLAGSGLPSGYSNALLKAFGSNRGEMLDQLGAPKRSTTSSVEWQGLTATFRGDEITSIKLTNSSREFQNGLKTGISRTDLQQIMGYPSNTKGRTLTYSENGKNGLSVQLDSKNIVSSITVNEI